MVVIVRLPFSVGGEHLYLKQVVKVKCKWCVTADK